MRSPAVVATIARALYNAVENSIVAALETGNRMEARRRFAAVYDELSFKRRMGIRKMAQQDYGVALD